MKEKTREAIKEIFYINNGYIRTKELSSKGINRKYLRDLIDEGAIERIKQGLYRWKDEKFDVEEDLVNVSKIVQHGVFCLASALSFYKLISYTPGEYMVAVKRNYNIKLPEYPPVKLYYFLERYYIDGIEEIDIYGNIIITAARAPARPMRCRLPAAFAVSATGANSCPWPHRAARSPSAACARR